MKFKKISAVLSTLLMAGLTLSTASAANYPAPFVRDGVGNVAIIYGTGAGVNVLDKIQAETIQESLSEFVEGGEMTVEGGESFKLERASDKFNFGNALNAFHASLDDGEMPNFLADGVYDDGNVDETFTQKITLSPKTLTFFSDADYNDRAPTIGFRWTNNEQILTYDLSFDDAVLFAQMDETNMPLFGKEYFVLTASATKIELLDSAEKVTVWEGETVTVDGRVVTIHSMDTTGVRFTVDGVNVNKLTSAGDYEKIGRTDSYIILNDWNFDTRDGRDSFAEFSIGGGKIILEDNKEVKINDEDVDGFVVDIIGSATELTDLKFIWSSDDETFLGEGDSIVMPVFEAISVVYGGLNFPEESEIISLDNGETLTLNMGNYELPIIWWDGTLNDAFLGEEFNPLVLARFNPTRNATGLYTNYLVNSTTNLVDGLELIEDNRFLVTKMDTDLTDINTIYYEVSNIDYVNPTDFEVTLRDLLTDTDLVFDSLELHDRDDIEIRLTAVGPNHAYFKFSAIGGATIAYNKAVSDTGLVVTLPTSVATLTDTTPATIIFREANRDGDIEGGISFNANVLASTGDRLHVSTTNVSTLEDADDVFVGYVVSDLASKVTHDRTGDENNFEIEYFGEEVTAEVIISAGGTVTESDGVLGDILVKDTEVASVSSKNLIIVGGSCVNSAAATLLGGAHCGAAFTQSTGIGPGQYLIRGFQDGFAPGKLALVVAGYEAADTVSAATYLTNREVDTSRAYRGTGNTVELI